MVEITLELLADLLNKPETYELEFKSGSNKFDYEKLGQYCSAMASSINGTGYIVIGVSDARPRDWLDTKAFQDPGHAESMLAQDLGINPRVKELYPDNKRVVVVQVPGDTSRMISFRGACYKREGESVRPMTGREIEVMASNRSRIDYSAQLSQARFKDLDPALVAAFRGRCLKLDAGLQGSELRGTGLRDSGLRGTSETDEEFLARLGLLRDGQATYAAIILFGTERTILSHLSNARVRYRWHTTHGVAPPSDEVNYVQGYLATYDEIWEVIATRNPSDHYLDKFHRMAIPLFDEKSVREAIINAVAHRDYAVDGHIHVVQLPDGIRIENPGGFPAGEIPDGMSPRSRPRNQLLADAFHRAGLAEQAGYGIQMLNTRAVQLGKALPDYSSSDDHMVRLLLDGKITNEDILLFFDWQEQLPSAGLSHEQYLALNAVGLGEEVTGQQLKAARKQLLKAGLIEYHGKGRGTSYYLAGMKPSPLKQLSGKAIKAIDDGILVMVELAGTKGIATANMAGVAHNMTYKQVRNRVETLAAAELIRRIGTTKDGRWVITELGIKVLQEIKDARVS